MVLPFKPGRNGVMKLIVVAAVALFNEHHEVLLAERPAGKSMAGLWEFPGGKLEVGETPEAALVRECEEELGIWIETRHLVPLTFASHSYQDPRQEKQPFHLLMPLYGCWQWKGDVRAREGQELAWVAVSALSEYPMPPADAPLVAYLQMLSAEKWVDGLRVHKPDSMMA